MNPVQMVGTVLTTIDTTLSRSDFVRSDPEWQQLYALRKHLDDQQRELVVSTVNFENDRYKPLVDQISAANTQITSFIDNPSQVANVVHESARLAASLDELLRLTYIEPEPKDKDPITTKKGPRRP